LLILCKVSKNFGFFPDKFVFLQQKSLFLKKSNKIMRKNIIVAAFVVLFRAHGKRTGRSDWTPKAVKGE
jgi:hypothetical protein